MKPWHALIPILFLATLFSSRVISQPASRTMYVAERSGLNMREKPDISAKRILSVPYGTKLQVVDTGKPGEIEGIKDTWYKTSYNGKEGYILGVYLTILPLPQGACRSFRTYFSQITGTKDEGKMMDILQKKFSVSYSEGGKTCASGYTAVFENHQIKDIFLLSRVIYDREFPILKKQFSSIAKNEGGGLIRIEASSKATSSITDISIESQGDNITFQEITTEDPCEP